MKNVEYWQRRLTTAAHEADDADRVWRQAMRRHDDSEAAPGALLVLWQERERANARVVVLEGYVTAAQRRRDTRVRTRIRTARHALAFVMWHLSVRWHHGLG